MYSKKFTDFAYFRNVVFQPRFEFWIEHVTGASSLQSKIKIFAVAHTYIWRHCQKIVRSEPTLITSQIDLKNSIFPTVYIHTYMQVTYIYH